jgi:uncharacterized protein (TIGR02246 family)
MEMTTCALGAILAAVWTVAAMPIGHKSDAEEIMSLEDAAMERWRQGDPLGWAEIAAPDITYFDPSLDAPIVGREAFTAYMASLAGKIHYQGSEYLEPRVHVYGETAVLTYRYRSTVLDEQERVTRTTLWNTTEIYARVGGAWRIVHSHWAYNHGLKPDGSAAAE